MADGECAKFDGALEYLAVTREDNDNDTFTVFARESLEAQVNLATLERSRWQVQRESGVLQEKFAHLSPDQLNTFLENEIRNSERKIEEGKRILSKPGYETAPGFMAQIRKNLLDNKVVVSKNSELMGKLRSEIETYAMEGKAIPYRHTQRAFGIGLAALKVREFGPAADAVALAEASGYPNLKELEEITRQMDGPARGKFQTALEYSRNIQKDYKA